MAGKIMYCLICGEDVTVEIPWGDPPPNFCTDCGNPRPFTQLKPGSPGFIEARTFYCKSLDSHNLAD